MQRFYRKFRLVSSFALLAALFPVATQAQEFSLGTESVEAYLTEHWVTIVLITLRFAMVFTLIIAGMVGFRSGYNWLYAERNIKKQHDNKQKLGNAIILVTILFFALAMFHVFVPDYSVLQLP